MQLRTYQADAVEFLDQQQRMLLALPPGAGKTAIVSSWLREVDAARILVVAPNGPVLEHWRHELLLWGQVIGINGTGTPKQRAAWREASKGGALVINYECMRNDIDALAEIEWDAVVFDESHRLKGRKVTFKAAQKLAKRTERLVLVTGTPVLNKASELWVSLHLMDPGKYRSYWRWVDYHFHVVHPRYGRRIVRQVCSNRTCRVCGGRGVLPDHVAVLKGQIGQRMFYRPLKDILPDLPPVIETTYEVELTEAERKAYESMLADFWMEVGEEIVHAPNAVAKMTRLRQLCSDWSCFGEPPGTKAQAAAQLVAGMDDEQVLVFCAYRKTADAVAGLIPGARAYHGGLDAEERSQLIEAFKAGDLTCLVATIATLGEGVDGLQVARNTIFIDRDWTPARNDQAVARLRRQGQANAVNVIHVVAHDTTDDVVAAALRTKRDVVSAVIENHR